MQGQKKVELIKNDGSKVSIDLISLFKIKTNDLENDYILLTANEVDQNGLIKILASKVVSGKLEKIVDQNEWALVKAVMRSIISSSKGNFEYVNMGDVSLSYVVSDDFARIIAVQEAAKMQLIKDYEEKKPEPQPAKEVEEAPVKNPNDVIYPQSNGESAGSEVSPGISEAVSSTPEVKQPEINPPVIDKPVSNSSVGTFEKVPVESSFSVEAATPNVVPDVPEKTDFVSKVEDAPLKDIVNNIENNKSDDGLAKEKLIEAIQKAVDDYVESIKDDKSESLEINALKTNINVMQEQLDKINKTLNTHE